jgi:hypothetical protein
MAGDLLCVPAKAAGARSFLPQARISGTITPTDARAAQSVKGHTLTNEKGSMLPVQIWRELGLAMGLA